jgi:hypothetical protein
MSAIIDTFLTSGKRKENLLHDAKHDPQAATYSTAVHEIANMVLSVGASDADRKAIRFDSPPRGCL